MADAGSATVATLAVVLALALAFTAGVGAAAAVDAGMRARAAADLAALHAAYEARDARALRHGTGDACDVANEVAQWHHARLAECAVTPGGVVHVRVEVTAAGGAGLDLITLSRRATAGPSGAR